MTTTFLPQPVNVRPKSVVYQDVVYGTVANGYNAFNFVHADCRPSSCLRDCCMECQTNSPQQYPPLVKYVWFSPANPPCDIVDAHWHENWLKLFLYCAPTRYFIMAYVALWPWPLTRILLCCLHVTWATFELAMSSHGINRLTGHVTRPSKIACHKTRTLLNVVNVSRTVRGWSLLKMWSVVSYYATAVNYDTEKMNF